MASLFTKEELEELRRFDEQVERDYEITLQEIAAGDLRDSQARGIAKARESERHKAYYVANREKIKAKQNKYYQDHKDERISYAHKRYFESHDLILARQRAYYQKHREERLEYNKEYRRKKKAERYS